MFSGIRSTYRLKTDFTDRIVPAAIKAESIHQAVTTVRRKVFADDLNKEVVPKLASGKILAIPAVRQVLYGLF